MVLSAQDMAGLSGMVTDEAGEPLPNAAVVISDLHPVYTDVSGYFAFENLTPGAHRLKVHLLGYLNYDTTVMLHAGNNQRSIILMAEALQLAPVTISGKTVAERNRMHSLDVVKVDAGFVERNLAGDLMKTLRSIPGISSIDIGSGQSKPVIRGLSFNRVVVTEGGIKHEGQQWGDDHGLEIDRFNAETIEIVKGPASLIYGSDAIGGVISIQPYRIPATDGTVGSVLMHHSSNNRLYGISTNLFGRQNNLFYNARITANTNGDYRIPADTIVYNTYNLVLRDGFMRNTAGRELNIFAGAGYSGKKGISVLSIGNYTQKAGFYADVHGLEIRQSKIDHDASNSDIQLPYQHVNHFKAIWNNTLFLGENKLEIDLGFQNNHRKEFTEPSEHGYMPLPPDSLEREFNKNIFDLKAGYHHDFSATHFSIAGFDVSYHHNEIGGWGFIIPSYRRLTVGAYVYNRINLNPHFYLNAGIRFDIGTMHIDKYRDWYATPIFDGHEEPVGEVFKLRSSDMQKSFANLTWSGGFGYEKGRNTLKGNFGKGFRIPDARELATDGVNYHRFRQERGDSSIVAETAWQIDLAYAFETQKTAIRISPFFSWFPNYIYLNPTSGFSPETGLQIFNYVQNEVMRWGGEIQVEQQITNHLRAKASIEYVWAEQMSGDKKGFGLALLPPPALRVGCDWSPVFAGKLLNGFYLSGGLLIAGGQNRIVPPEEPTSGYAVVNLSAGSQIMAGTQQVNISLQINNILNRKYFDHTSYYRIINVPAPARNFQVVVSMPFGMQKEQSADNAGINLN